jgi:hypothetical protein
VSASLVTDIIVILAAAAEMERMWSPRVFSRRVGIRLSQVEVRFEDLNIETDVFVGSRALPSVTNEFLNYAQARRPENSASTDPVDSI